MAPNPPARTGFTLPGWSAGALLFGARLPFGQWVLSERERWPLWVPVGLGIGAASYFACPAEPPVWVGPAVFLAAMACQILARRLVWLQIIAFGLALVAFEFANAGWRSQWVAQPVLDRPTGAITVSGVVAMVELLPEGGRRLTLEQVEGPFPHISPTKIRVTAKAGPPVAVGDWITLRASLMPPPRPAMPGAYDFTRQAWFMGLGAIGSAIGPPLVVTGPEGKVSWRNALNLLRQKVNEKIRAVLPGPEGGIAIALITGEITGIPAGTLAAYRNSGLAHILDISGLHMAMVGGLVFGLFRGGLALIPAIALRHPIKKWAAVGAIAVMGFYTLLAGTPVPATRSFIMASAVLIAVILDRSALTMRLWALAATVILIAEPEQITAPGFQMSFAAVAALIATYEYLGPKLQQLRQSYRGPLWAAGHHLAGLLITSMAAGSATTVYGFYHFSRIAVFQVAANLIAVPLTGVLVMPFALAALVLMPFGLEAWALIPLGWGIALLSAIASWVSGWPNALVTVASMPSWGLVVFSLGGLWLCLWRRRWRLAGVAVMLIGLASIAFERKPDLLIDGRGQAIAVRGADGSLLLKSGGRIIKETWGRRAGPLAEAWWPKQGRSADGRLSCEKNGCLYRLHGRIIAYVTDESGLEAACSGPEIVISAVPIRGACRGARWVIDRFDLWRRGTHALWLEAEGGVRIETVAAIQGDRPWSFHPLPRRKAKPVQDNPEPAPDED